MEDNSKSNQEARDIFNDVMNDNGMSDTDDEGPEIIGYSCLGCFHIQEGDGYCDRCNAYAMEPMFE